MRSSNMNVVNENGFGEVFNLSYINMYIYWKTNFSYITKNICLNRKDTGMFTKSKESLIKWTSGNNVVS